MTVDTGIKMIEGIVKYFNDVYGFGFIETDGEKDVFVHYSDIQDKGFKTLHDGELLRFNIIDGAKGPVAKNVVKLSPTIIIDFKFKK